MKIDITINVNLDEIKELLTNVEELRQWVVSNIDDIREWVINTQEYGMALNRTVEDEPEPEEDSTAANENEKEEEPASEKPIKLEDVRVKLTALSQSGKQEQIKALIEKFGAKKLTEISAEKYSRLLKEAEAL